MNFLRAFVIGTLTVIAAAVPPMAAADLTMQIGMSAPVIVREAPPPRPAETRTASPGAEYTWIPGHHSLRSSQWVWVSGRWVKPPQLGLAWVEGRWDEGTRSWTGEHWKYAQTTMPPAVKVAPAAQAAVAIPTPPPPPRIERRINRPGAGFVWVNGYWAYRGGRHVWIAGHWVRPPRAHQVWIEPRWERRGSTYIFVEGRWR